MNAPISGQVAMGDYLHGFMTGLANALRSKKRQVIEMKLSSVSPFNLGMLIALYERAVAAYAELIHINAFHQPGVQAYKLASKGIIQMLTELEEKLNCVKNFSIAVKEQGDSIIFLRKIVKGGADKSYGIQVARLAGLPEEILKRAGEIVEVLSLNDINSHERSEMIKSSSSVSEKYRQPVQKRKKQDPDQLSLFAERKFDNILDDIRELDISSITPIQALNKLSELQEELRNQS